MKTYTIKDFENQFPNDDACLEFLFQARYPQGVTCPKCQKVTPHYRIANRKVYSCQFCGTQVSPMAGTIFHKSDTPLRSWFHAIFLMASTKTGISAKQLQRELGVTYKTAWRIFKEVVMGIVERNGNAVTRVIPNVKAKTLLPMIEANVAKANKTIVFTDELPSYNRVTRLGYTHQIVQHSARQYVSGIAHVNTVESLWSTIKRGIDGVNHSVSPLYLQSYLDSYVYRYNHRKDEQPMFQSLLNRVALVAQPS